MKRINLPHFLDIMQYFLLISTVLSKIRFFTIPKWGHLGKSVFSF